MIERLTGALRQTAGPVAFVADLLTIGSFAVLAIGLVAGLVSSSLIALAVVAIAAVAIDAVLVTLVLRHRRRIQRIRRLMGVPPFVDAPDAWLPDPRNLSSLTLSNADLEDTLAAATVTAVNLGGPDTRVDFSFMQLLTAEAGSPTVFYDARSKASGRKFTISVDSALEPRAFDVARASVSDSIGKPPPWRQDPSWPELIGRSWARMRPFVGRVWLTYPDSKWVASYTRFTDGVRESTVEWTLSDGELLDPKTIAAG